jgi:hypothetical protein
MATLSSGEWAPLYMQEERGGDRQRAAWQGAESRLFLFFQHREKGTLVLHTLSWARS